MSWRAASFFERQVQNLFSRVFVLRTINKYVASAAQVSTEQCDFWLVALRELSRAEQRVLSGASCTVRVLSDAVVLYHKAAAALNVRSPVSPRPTFSHNWASLGVESFLDLVCRMPCHSGLSAATYRARRDPVDHVLSWFSLQAATTPSTPLNFQTQYVQLRTQLFQAHVQLDRACASFRTSPPPAIATSRAMSTGDEIHKYGHVVEQVRDVRRSGAEEQRGTSRRLAEVAFTSLQRTGGNRRFLSFVLSQFRTEEVVS